MDWFNSFPHSSSIWYRNRGATSHVRLHHPQREQEDGFHHVPYIPRHVCRQHVLLLQAAGQGRGEDQTPLHRVLPLPWRGIVSSWILVLGYRWPGNVSDTFLFCTSSGDVLPDAQTTCNYSDWMYLLGRLFERLALRFTVFSDTSGNNNLN